MKKSLAHKVWECNSRIVWVPKNQRAILFLLFDQIIGFQAFHHFFAQRFDQRVHRFWI
jgi:hypothetical protein